MGGRWPGEEKCKAHNNISCFEMMVFMFFYFHSLFKDLFMLIRAGHTSFEVMQEIRTHHSM